MVKDIEFDCKQCLQMICSLESLKQHELNITETIEFCTKFKESVKVIYILILKSN